MGMGTKEERLTAPWGFEGRLILKRELFFFDQQKHTVPEFKSFFPADVEESHPKP
jgi:hypothetical protein